MIMVLITSLANTRERERSTLESLLATLVRPLEVMVGKITPYIIVRIYSSLYYFSSSTLFIWHFSGRKYYSIASQHPSIYGRQFIGRSYIL